MKRCIADGSVGFPHVRVGHRQASKKETPIALAVGVFCGKQILLTPEDIHQWNAKGLRIAWLRRAPLPLQRVYRPAGLISGF